MRAKGPLWSRRARIGGTTTLKVLVTGAAGFVGSHLCEALGAAGHEVVGVDSFDDYYPARLKRRTAAKLSETGVGMIRCDLAGDELQRLLPESAAVFHLAAQPGISASVGMPVYVRNNVMATHALLESCSTWRQPPLFVYASTSSVYGKRATSPETAAPAPTSYYGVTKLAAEQLALAYWREGRLPVCAMRLYSVYGPRERPDKLFSKLIVSLLAERQFPLHEGSREHRRSFTYVGDAVAGLVSVLARRSRGEGEIFNIGSDVERTTGDVIDTVERIVGRKARFRIVPPRPGDQIETRARIEKARNLLGYAPRTALVDGLERQVAWCRENLLRYGE